MPIRDQILNASGDFNSETVDVPEWGVKLVIRELSVADRGALTLSDLEQVEGPGGSWLLKPKLDPIAAAHLVVKSAYDENGERVFLDDDAEQLAKRSFSVVNRLADIARRLSGFGKDLKAEIGKIVEQINDGADLNAVQYALVQALDEDETGVRKAAGKESSPTPPAETSTP